MNCPHTTYLTRCPDECGERAFCEQCRVCRNCGAEVDEHGDVVVECPRCEGAGMLEGGGYEWRGNYMETGEPCPDCDGEGRVWG